MIESAIDKLIINGETKDFKQLYCYECYWHKHHQCNIEVVGIKHCCSSTVKDAMYPKIYSDL